MTYITSDELKASLEMTGESYADADVDVAVAAASSAIEGQCRRRFTLDQGTSNVRYYTPVSRRLVEIDDLVQITEFATGLGDGTFATVWAQDTQYLLEPMNAAADGWPYTLVRVVTGRLPQARRTVRVTGQFGWPAVPDPIKAATSLLASRIMRRIREAPFGVVMIGLEGQPSQIAQTDPDIKQLIKPYTRLLVA